jgi:hypothetical protein
MIFVDIEISNIHKSMCHENLPQCVLSVCISITMPTVNILVRFQGSTRYSTGGERLHNGEEY